MNKANKVLNLFLSEGMTADDIIKDAEKAIEYFKTEMTNLFGLDYYNTAYYRDNLGKSVTYSMANVSKEDVEKDYLNFMNASVNYKFMLHMTDDYGRDVFDKFGIDIVSSTLRDNGVKYRKISGKTPLEATKKLVAWFKANKETLDTIERRKIK